MSMINEYFEIYEEKCKEYGPKTAVLYACGSFYEVYSIDNETEKIGNAQEIANVLHIVYTSKNKNLKCSRTSPNFCGFGTAYIDKYLDILLSEGYTAVIVDQLEESSNKSGKLVKRGITAVYSPSLLPLDNDKIEGPIESDTNGNTYESSLMSIFIEEIVSKTVIKQTSIIISFVIFNNMTNEITIIERHCNNYKDLCDIITGVFYMYRSIEIIIHFKDIQQLEDLEQSLATHSIKYIKKDFNKEYFKINIQREYLKNAYKHYKFGLIDPIEYLGLSMYSLSIINLMHCIDFVARHNINYINNIKKPTFIHENNYLKLELNTLEQLNVMGNGLFKILNKTHTVLGRRYLKQLLCCPFKYTSDIINRYALINSIQDSYDILNRMIQGILDITYLHRKMSLCNLNPNELCKLYYQYIKISDLLNYNSQFNITFSQQYPLNNLETLKQSCMEMIQTIENTFDLSILNTSTNTDIFQKGIFQKSIFPHIDKIIDDINNIENEIENIRQYYDSFLGSVGQIKLNNTEQEGHYLSLTKLRYNTLSKSLDQNELKNMNPKIMSNQCKLFTTKLTEYSNKLSELQITLKKEITTQYQTFITTEYNKYYNIFPLMKEYIEILDVCLCALTCKQKYNYSQPIINDSQDSNIVIKNLRHPIIERLNVEFIPNDITLDNNNKGYLVYGINSSGKSSLLRAIGLCVIMSQAGFFSPCSEIQLSPFHTIISQVDLTDDLFTGKSSFINEMRGLKKIINVSGPNTLVLSDEMCKGTEYFSSVSLVSSVINYLIKNNSKFFFTSHLHSISDVVSTNVKICHLDIQFKNDTIIYTRKLQEGQGSTLYGLEVAKNIIQNNEIIDSAFKIRNELLDINNDIITLKKSHYNHSKLMSKCELCSSNKMLEVHHINFQKNANPDGFIKGKSFHKNELFNLCTLCHECHQQVTKGTIIITGYKDTVDGKILEYFNA